jgi:hypothetical protein
VLLPDELVVDAAGGVSLKRKMAAEVHGSVLLTNYRLLVWVAKLQVPLAADGVTGCEMDQKASVAKLPLPRDFYSVPLFTLKKAKKTYEGESKVRALSHFISSTPHVH